jgi:TolB protein
MIQKLPILALTMVLAGSLMVAAGQQPPSQQPSEVGAVISSGDPGSPPRLAVPDFIALSTDSETIEAARLLASVLWDDLSFEREYALVPKDVTATIPRHKTMLDVPFERWRELNTDGVVVGTVQRIPKGKSCPQAFCLHVEFRLFAVKTGQSVLGRAYDAALGDRRYVAHTISDELHKLRSLVGVARTKLTYNSDRANERIRNTVENRGVKEIFISDYDGQNELGIIRNGSLNLHSTWSPNARSILYTSWRDGGMQVFLSNPYEATGKRLTSPPGENSLPAWSPDGRRVAFVSTRHGEGNSEIYVMNADGSNPVRLTNHSQIDTSPTWSPSGSHIAFISDRSGNPQLYVVGADGTDLQQLTRGGKADRPTWSPAPYNEIAYSWQVGGGFEIMIMNFQTRDTVQLTGLKNGEGSNESPAFSPNGRHIAFTSTRAGKEQIFTMTRDGRDVRQLTRQGNNRQANWSSAPAL